MPIYTPRTGVVWIRDFDRGVIERLGGTIAIPGKSNYYVTFPANQLGPTTSIHVPVIISNPEQIYEDRVFPSFLVTRDSMEPALARWHEHGSIAYSAGVPGTEVTINGVQGFTSIETLRQAWPYDFRYTVSCFSRYEAEAQNLLAKIMRSFQPRIHVIVKDSLNQTRTYDCYAEGTQDIGEYIDVADRTRAYSISFRIEGELDLVDPQVVDSVAQTIVQNSGVL